MRQRPAVRPHGAARTSSLALGPRAVAPKEFRGHRAHPRPDQARRRRPRPGGTSSAGSSARACGWPRWSCAPWTGSPPRRTTPSIGRALFAGWSSSSPPGPSSRRCRGSPGDRGVRQPRRARPTRSRRPPASSAADHASRCRQHRARLRLARVDQARDRPVLPEPVEPEVVPGVRGGHQSGPGVVPGEGRASVGTRGRPGVRGRYQPGPGSSRVRGRYQPGPGVVPGEGPVSAGTRVVPGAPTG